MDDSPHLARRYDQPWQHRLESRLFGCGERRQERNPVPFGAGHDQSRAPSALSNALSRRPTVVGSMPSARAARFWPPSRWMAKKTRKSSHSMGCIFARMSCRITYFRNRGRGLRLAVVTAQPTNRRESRCRSVVGRS
jgi:hypothetical protein